MKKSVLWLIAFVCLAVMPARAAMFTTSPAILQENSKDVKIFFDPSQCDVAALKTATELYAHVGVTLTSDPTAWKHVISDWNSNNAKWQYTKNANGLWELNIGDIRSFFNVGANETVAAIAIIARTGDGKAQTADNFIPVQPAGFQMQLTYNVSSLVIQKATKITFTVSTTENSAIELTVNGSSIGKVSNAMELTASYNFDKKGSFYTVKATASNGTETLTEEATVAYPEASAKKNYPGGVPKMGHVQNSDGTVTFCLAAPNKQSVIIVPSWDGYQVLSKNVMNYQDYNGYRYFWITTDKKLNDGKDHIYYYLVDGTIKVADPYAEVMLDPYNDKWMSAKANPNKPKYPYDKMDDTMLAVYNSKMRDYNWKVKNFQIPDHSSLTIYELLLRDFTGDGTDQDGKAFGTLKTAQAKLNYLKELGVNAVELMPIMEFAGNSSWGYNNNGYMALDKIYGNPKDLRDFVDGCHELGMAVILDIVFNQADGLHPWYQMYPANANPFFNEYAPHSYSVLNDWNQDCPIVAKHWEDVLRFWMEAYNVDGFRFDLVKGLGSNASYGGGGDGNTNKYNASRVEKMKSLHAVIKSVKPNGIHINELLGDASEDKAYGNDGQLCWSKINEGSYQYAMGFANGSSLTKGFLASQWGRVVGQTVDYAESHDEERVAYKVKQYGANGINYKSAANPNAAPRPSSIRRLGSVAAQLLLCPGAKMIWQFGEVGADDVQGTELEKLRSIAPKWDHFDVETRAALYENYRQLCNLRSNNPDMFGTQVSCSLAGFEDNLDKPRTIRLVKGDKEIIGFFNPSLTQEKTITCTASKLSASNSQLITAGYGNSPVLAGSGNVSVKVPANSFAVFATANVSGSEEIFTDTFGGSDVEVYPGEGCIYIDGDYTSAEVYNMQGQRQASLNVPAGLYVVRVDGVSFKVAVK